MRRTHVRRGIAAARRGTAARRGRRIRTAGTARAGAQRSLRRFSQATILAVALTAFLLLLFGADPGAAQEAEEGAPVEQIEQTTPDPSPPAAEGETPGDAPGADTLAREATSQARETFEGLWIGLVSGLPQLAVALLVLFLAWGFLRLVNPLLHKVSNKLRKGNAFTALTHIAVWLLAVGIAVSVIAGDIRALLGSLGLVGLALSWALQTPIEGFTGWLLNSFKGYYRVGDRIAVGEVFGDVVQIDVLTTTVWEYGGADRAPSGITAEQPTGRLITFPNNEVLTGSIVNYTRDFPFVWDELAVSLAAESDIRYAIDVTQRLADGLLQEQMAEPAAVYVAILQQAGLGASIADRPEVFVMMTDSGVDLVVRYLVGARERRRWKSDLTALVVMEFNRPEHEGRILPLYPRQQIQLVGPDGAPAAWSATDDPGHGQGSGD